LRREFALAWRPVPAPAARLGLQDQGLDRSLKALAALPPELRTRCLLIAIGDDDPRFFQGQAQACSASPNASHPAGTQRHSALPARRRPLLHPAYNENTGTVLLEALVAGLPVLATAVCGYAHYIVEADAGVVIDEPFVQSSLDQTLLRMLTDEPARRRWQANGLAFAEVADIYANAERAADVILK
jgi:UDP-glucose:(heptosyl)LPS alpha-1,3-glucosyltransferase